jgi:hypothetical protein
VSDTPAAVRFEAHRGELILGETVVEARAAGPRGALRIGGADGPTLGPVTFGERTRAATRATSSSSPRDALCAALLHAATVVDGPGDRLVMETAALWLAGAAELSPSFGDTALAVARGSGWDPSQIAEAEAADVDRLAATLGVAPAHRPWLRVIFGASAAEPLQALRDEMADTLLARAVIENPAAAPAADAVDLWGAPATPGEPASPHARRSTASVDAPALAGTPEPAPGGHTWLASPSVSPQTVPLSPTAVTPIGTPRPRRSASAATALRRRALAERRATGPADADRPTAPAVPTAPPSVAAPASSAVRGATPATPGRVPSWSAPVTRFPATVTAAAALAGAGGERTLSDAESPTPLVDGADLADGLATLLDGEADLRGLAR